VLYAGHKNVFASRGPMYSVTLSGTHFMGLFICRATFTQLCTVDVLSVATVAPVWFIQFCYSVPFCYAAKVTELDHQIVYYERELKVQANDIINLQKMLNTSRHEYRNLENQLESMEHDLAQHRVFVCLILNRINT